MKAVKVYRWLYILAVFIGPYMTVEAVWTIADIFNGLMAIPNMICNLRIKWSSDQGDKGFHLKKRNIYLKQLKIKVKQTAGAQHVSNRFKGEKKKQVTQENTALTMKSGA